MFEFLLQHNNWLSSWISKRGSILSRFKSYFITLSGFLSTDVLAMCSFMLRTKYCATFSPKSNAQALAHTGTLGKRRPSPIRIWSAPWVHRIQTADPDYFSNLTGSSLSKDTSVMKLWWSLYKTTPGFPETWPNVKNARSRSVEEQFEKFLDPHPEADHFQKI